jgi:hypothetical protein
LKEEGITGIPENINQLYDLFSDKLKLRWRGLDTFFDWFALRAIRASLTTLHRIAEKTGSR